MKLQFDARLVAPVIRDTCANIAVSARTFGMIFLASTAAGVGLDLSDALGDAAILFSFLFAFFQLFLQACIIIAILQASGHIVRSRQWRIASLFGIGIVTGLGIFVGLLLLVLPGLYFAGRWFLAGPILFAEDSSVSEQCRRVGSGPRNIGWPARSSPSWLSWRRWCRSSQAFILLGFWKTGRHESASWLQPTYYPKARGSSVLRLRPLCI